MKTFTNNCLIRRNRKGLKKKEEEQIEICLYAIPIFWKLIQDNNSSTNKLSLEIIEAAYHLLLEMLNLNLDIFILENYFIDCFENIKSSTSIVQSLNLSKHIFEKLRVGQYTSSRVNDFLKELNKKYSFIELIIEDFERYMNHANNIVQDSEVFSKDLEGSKSNSFLIQVKIENIVLT